MGYLRTTASFCLEGSGTAQGRKVLLGITEHAQMRAIPLSDRLAVTHRVSYERAIAEMDELFA
jgi:hypothetical protein